MASKYGTRPVGTDGSDFWHRESVAWQYRISSINKSRLKIDLTVHTFLGILMLVRILPSITAFLGIGPVERLRNWKLPATRPWELCWIVSLVAVLFAWKALPKNEIALLRQYVIGTVLFGVIPIIYGVIDQMDDLYNYLNEKTSTGEILGYPAVLVWFLFLVISAQLHGFGLYFSAQLLSAWKTRIDKKVK